VASDESRSELIEPPNRQGPGGITDQPDRAESERKAFPGTPVRLWPWRRLWDPAWLLVLMNCVVVPITVTRHVTWWWYIVMNIFVGALLLLQILTLAFVSIRISEGKISGPTPGGLLLSFARAGFPLTELDRARSAPGSPANQHRRVQHFYSTGGDEIVFYRKMFRKTDVLRLLTLLAIDGKPHPTSGDCSNILL
jgi:hypothetical protein